MDPSSKMGVIEGIGWWELGWLLISRPCTVLAESRCLVNSWWLDHYPPVSCSLGPPHPAQAPLCSQEHILTMPFLPLILFGGSPFLSPNSGRPATAWAPYHFKLCLVSVGDGVWDALQRVRSSDVQVPYGEQHILCTTVVCILFVPRASAMTGNNTAQVLTE